MRRASYVVKPLWGLGVLVASLGIPATSHAQWNPAPPRPWGPVQTQPSWSPPPKPLPPPSVQDSGFTQTASVRAGYASGLRIGASIALSHRWTTWPYRTAYGVDGMEITLFGNPEYGEIGGRVAFLSAFFSLWSDSVFQGGYLRWNLVDVGGAARSNGWSTLEFTSALSFGYSYELSDGIALRVGEIGLFGGAISLNRSKGDSPVLFDGGLTFDTGITFR